MLSVLKITLQEKFQNFVTNNVLLDKKKVHNNNKTKSNMKTLAGAGN